MYIYFLISTIHRFQTVDIFERSALVHDQIDQHNGDSSAILVWILPKLFTVMPLLSYLFLHFLSILLIVYSASDIGKDPSDRHRNPDAGYTNLRYG